MKKRTGTHLINERCELVVESLNLVFLIRPHSLELGVNLHLYWPQQVGVDVDLLDASANTSLPKTRPGPLFPKGTSTKASSKHFPA